jgi:hypothetical protein
VATAEAALALIYFGQLACIYGLFILCPTVWMAAATGANIFAIPIDASRRRR